MARLTGNTESQTRLGNLVTSTTSSQEMLMVLMVLMVGMLGMFDMRLLCPVGGGSGLSSRPQFVT